MSLDVQTGMGTRVEMLLGIPQNVHNCEVKDAVEMSQGKFRWVELSGGGIGVDKDIRGKQQFCWG